MADCTFCRILAEQLAASVVHDDDRVLAFLDIAPMAVGHTLVVPKVHEPSSRRLDEAAAQAVWRVARLVARAVTNATGAEAISYLAADGEAGGQEVPHAPLHVVPRRRGDGLGFRLPPGHGPHAARDELDAVAARVAAAIANGAARDG